MRNSERVVVWLAAHGRCPAELRASFEQQSMSVEERADAEALLRHDDDRAWAAVQAIERIEQLQAGLHLPRLLWLARRRAAVVLLLPSRRTSWIDRGWHSGAADVVLLPATDSWIVQRVRAAGEAWAPIGAALAESTEFAGRLERLSERERMVLHDLAAGSWPKRIAHQWGTSPNTVRNQRTTALAKLGARSQTEVMRALWDLRWLQLLGRHRGLST